MMKKEGEDARNVHAAAQMREDIEPTNRRSSSFLRASAAAERDAKRDARGV
jgi:hypothetical protein